MDLIKRLLMNEEGQGLVEYSLIISFIAVAIIVAVINFRIKVIDLYTENNTKLPF